MIVVLQNTYISVVSMLGSEQLHGLPLGSVCADGVAGVKVRVARAEEVPLVTVSAAAIKAGPCQRGAHEHFVGVVVSVVQLTSEKF